MTRALSFGDTETVVRRAVDIINGKLDFQDNMSCAKITIPNMGPADTSYLINHGLGRTPIGYIVNIDRAGVVYDYQRTSWTTVQMTLKCSVPNAEVTLVVF